MYQQSIILIKKIKNIYIYKKADIHFLNVTKVNIRGLYPKSHCTASVVRTGLHVDKAA